jgi:Uncharacterized membrane protein (homolog of Drosophila rhomboid)
MNRSYEVSDDDHQPLTWVQGRPLYATHLILAVLVITLLVTTVGMAAGARGFLDTLVFNGAAVLAEGQLWRVFTYGFVNPPSLFFVIDLVLLAVFGREVEKHLGRKSFLRLYVLAYLVPPLFLAALSFWHPLTHSGYTGALVVFVAFATLYPGAALMFNLLAGWVAAGLVGIFTLVALAHRDWPSLVALWSSTAFAFAYIRHSQDRLVFSLPRFRRNTAKSIRNPASTSARDGTTRTPTSSVRHTAGPSSSDDMAEVDALLDKIGRSGLDSLTPSEHARLAAAQARLAKRFEHRS